MDKKVVRKTNSRVTPKKAQAKKVTPAAPKNKLPQTKAKIKEDVFIAPATVECRHCHKDFEKGLTVCPYCRKSQKDQTGTIVITILSVILLISIIGNHFINLYYEKPVNESDYKFNCRLTSYEEMVRSPKDFKYKDVKVIGKVVDVEGKDVSYGNAMTVTIDANLFSGDSEQLITFKYTDKNYEMGFIEGDIVTIYGSYKSINGNTPFIDAKYIVFGS